MPRGTVRGVPAEQAAVAPHHVIKRTPARPRRARTLRPEPQPEPTYTSGANPWGHFRYYVIHSAEGWRLMLCRDGFHAALVEGIVHPTLAGAAEDARSMNIGLGYPENLA